MDITLAGTGLTYRPNDDQLGRVSLEFAAFDGEVGTGQLPVPDVEAAITVAGGRIATVEEGATLIGNQYIIDQDRDRGPIPAGTARQYSFGVMDANCLLGGFVVLRSDPAQTDYARVMAWAADYLPTADTTWVLNASTVTLPKKHYDTDGGFGELITDLVEFTGKTMFLHDKAAGGLCLHYHLLTNGHTCGLTISDVAGAEDRVTVFSPWSPTRQRTSVDLVNTVRGRDQAGRTHTSTDPTSITAHNVDGLKHQALIDFDTTSGADLTVKTNALLASQKDERDTYTCQIGPLDEDALALIRVGDRITVTSSVMGLTASAQRIAHMTLTVVVGENGRARAGWWMAALEMGAPVRRRARVKGSTRGVIVITNPPIGVGDDGNVEVCYAVNINDLWNAGPHDTVFGTITFPPCAPDLSLVSCTLATNTITCIQDTGGNHQNIGLAEVNDTFLNGGYLTGLVTLPPLAADQYLNVQIVAHSPSNFGLDGPILVLRRYSGVDGGTPSTTPGTLIGTPDVTSFIDLGIGTTGAVTLRWKFDLPLSTTYRMKAWLNGTIEPDWQITDTASRFAEDLDRINIYFVAGNSASMTTVMSDTMWCYSDGDVPVAFAGQQYGPVFIATADGTTSTYDLPAYPGVGYVPGSLMVFVDGVWQPVDSETDPVGPPGQFDLGEDPDVGDVIDAAWRVPP